MWRFVLCQYSLTVFVSVRVFIFFFFVSFFLSVRVPLCVSLQSTTQLEKKVKNAPQSLTTPQTPVSLQSLYFPIYSFKIKKTNPLSTQTRSLTLLKSETEKPVPLSPMWFCVYVFSPCPLHFLLMFVRQCWFSLWNIQPLLSLFFFLQ